MQPSGHDRARQLLFPSLLRYALVVAALTVTANASAQRAAERGPAIFPALNEDQHSAKQRKLRAFIPSPSRDDRPANIVLFFADDLGYADVGCFGSEAIPTPHIDSIARDGMRFTEAYVSAASCSPSRAGMLTGRYQNRFGFEFNTGSGRITRLEGRGLDPAAITIADVLRRGGYATGIIGKWHLGNRAQYLPSERGFDEFFGFLAGAHHFLNPDTLTAAERAIESGGGAVGAILRGTQPVDEPEYLTDALAREAVDFIGRHRDHPFFLYLPFNAVHTPIQATENYRRRFSEVDDLKRRTYYAMTSAMDDAVGRVLAALDQHDLADDTMVIFFNDNGGPTYTGVQSNGPLRLGKLFLFEGGIRVPLAVRYPGTVPPGAEHGEVVSSLDLFPTLAAVAGVEIPSSFSLDGVNLLPALRGEDTGPHHETLFWRNGPNKAVRHGKWKLVLAGEHTWLFDLATDVGETTNLAADEPDRVADLKRRLADWEQGLPPPAWPYRPDSRVVEVDGVPYQLAI